MASTEGESAATETWDLRRRVFAAIVLTVLWLACGLGTYALQFLGGTAGAISRLIPSPMDGSFFLAPGGWAVAIHGVAVLLVFTGFLAITSIFGLRMRGTFAAGWLAAILTGFLVGAVMDLGDFFAWVGLFGIRGALGTMNATSLTVFWALVVGWIPAIIAASGPRVTRPRTEANTGVAAISIAVLAVAAAIALPIVAQGANAASQLQLQEQLAVEEAAAEANADPNGAAPRDPEAEGDPVPNVGPMQTPPAANVCDSSNSTILAPPHDAATGHRLQSLQLVNTADEACTVEGYPDIAFGDQNGHVLDVVIEYGDSFMAQDAGPTAIVLEPGDAAKASIGWDANSVSGSLAARSLWVAQFAGTERLSWDVALDIVPGSTVFVTAWESSD